MDGFFTFAIAGDLFVDRGQAIVVSSSHLYILFQLHFPSHDRRHHRYLRRTVG
jgi:hypothetical protein